MAEITTTQAFSDGDTVTATKLNNITGNAAIQTEAITNRSAETTVDQANDLLLMYDASATALKKVTLSNVIKAGTASNFPVTGNATIGGTLGVTGASTLTGNTSVGGTLAVTGAITASSTVNGTTIPTSKTLVTTDDTQTLTGKTVNLASNTLSGTLAQFNTACSDADFASLAGSETLTNKTLTSPAINTGTISGGTINNAVIGGTTAAAGSFTTLSATSPITTQAGTAAAPAIVPTGDTNTGIFFPAADTIAFSEGGTESMRIDSSGNVILTGNKSLISRGAGGVSSNSAIGDGALQANTTGYNNTANGVAALYSNTTGYNNTANGGYALYSNTTGRQNTANGVAALYSNTTGYQNTANGVSALYSNTTGYYNTANGVAALYSNTTGYSNTATGFQAGYGATGTNANTTGSNNTFIGNEAVGSSATASNVITLGNSAIATLRCQVTTITALSDRRDKKDIVPLGNGLGLINALNPVSFVWNMRDGKKVGIPEIGFIAQELEEAQKQSGLTVPNLVYADNPERLEASPSTLIPILVKAVQELSEKVSQLEAKLKE